MMEKRVLEITHSHEPAVRGDALDWALAIYEILPDDQQRRIGDYLRQKQKCQKKKKRS